MIKNKKLSLIYATVALFLATSSNSVIFASEQSAQQQETTEYLNNFLQRKLLNADQQKQSASNEQKDYWNEYRLSVRFVKKCIIDQKTTSLNFDQIYDCITKHFDNKSQANHDLKKEIEDDLEQRAEIRKYIESQCKENNKEL